MTTTETRQPAAGGRASSVRAGAASGVLVPIRRGGRRPPLFAFSAGHGDVLSLGGLCRRLDADQPVYVLQPPPDAPRLAPADHLARRIGVYVDAIDAVQSGGPYRLLGNSSAGLLAVEAARILVARGERVDMVGLIDSPCRITRRNRLARLAIRPVMARLPASERLPRWLRAARGSARDLGFYGTTGALWRHRPAPIDAPLVLFLAERHWSVDGLLTGGFAVDVPRWRAVAAAGFAVETVPGSHTHIMLGPNSAVLLERLDARLAALTTEAP